MASTASPIASLSQPAADPVDRGTAPILQVCLFLLGALIGFGQLKGGFYSVGDWGIAGIVAGVLVVTLVVVRPWLPGPAALLVLGALGGLAVLSALSTLWAQSVPSASVEAYRWGLYAIVFAFGAWALTRDRERAAWLSGVGAAGTIVVLVLAVRLAIGDGGDLFVGLRLTDPLGYVNGQAACFLLTLWPAVAAAERLPWAVARGLAAGVAVLALGLLALTQSRAGILAGGVSAVVVLALIPHRVRRGYLLMVVAAGAVIAFSALNAVAGAATATAGFQAVGVVEHAGRVLLACALGASVVWGLGSWATEGPPGAHRDKLARVATWTLVSATVLAVIGGLLVVGNPVHRVSKQLSQFTTLSDLPVQDRLLAGTSNRYDYWQVALDEFKDEPLHGVGAGNYTRDYFRLRHTAEDVRQPHSLEMQALSELGLLGGVLILGLLGGLAWLVVGAGRRVARGEMQVGPAVAATGIVAAWTVQTSVDWLHLLPSLTAITLLAAAALAPGRATSGRGRWRVPGILAAVIATVLITAGMGRLVLADRALSRAEAALPNDPRAAVAYANRSLMLQQNQLAAIYVRAAGLARLDDYRGARDALLKAVRLEPTNFIPRALLGDLAIRRGDTAAALDYYKAALARNPRNETLRADLAKLEAARRGTTP